MSGHLSHLIGPKIRVALDNRNSWWRGSGAGVAEFFVIVRLPSWTPGTSHDGLRGTKQTFSPFFFGGARVRQCLVGKPVLSPSPRSPQKNSSRGVYPNFILIFFSLLASRRPKYPGEPSKPLYLQNYHFRQAKVPVSVGPGR